MKARISGIDVNFEVHGPEGAPWLVFSHSLACNVRMWDPQLAEFRSRYRIALYDTRGHGGTEAPAGPYTLDQLADDLHGLMSHLAIERAHFVGLSMGGMIGQTFALKYPGRFASLTLADTTSRYAVGAAQIWAERIRMAESRGMQALAQPTLERWFTEPYRTTHPDVMARVGGFIAGTPVAGYAGCSQAIQTIDVTARLGEIRCPILVLCGEQDVGTPPAMAREIHAHAPGSKLVMIDSAAHLSNMEQPELFNRALAEFLASAK